jgi:murein DD-endopeptidase MepM/ murein hydrolase activator NlpD
MAKNKYHFNPESLSYDRILVSFRTRLFRFVSWVAASIAIAIVYYAVFSLFFDSPKEKKLRRERDQAVLQVEMFGKRLENINTVLGDLQQRDDNIYRTIFQAEPIPSTTREAGFGGTNRYANLEGYAFSDLLIETAKGLDKVSKKIYVQSKSYDEVISLAKRKGEMLACTPAIQPISNRDLTRTASGFGFRIHPIYKIKMFHWGFDFTAPTGTEIYATGDGVIEQAKYSSGGYGNEVIINHGFGYKTLYGHMSGFKVRIGQKVKRGDVIGYVGDTGLSTAPHLHYEVIVNGKKVNPSNYFFNDLTAEEYDRMINISSNSNQTFD